MLNLIAKGVIACPVRAIMEKHRITLAGYTGDLSLNNPLRYKQLRHWLHSQPDCRKARATLNAFDAAFEAAKAEADIELSLRRSMRQLLAQLPRNKQQRAKAYPISAAGLQQLMLAIKANDL